MTIRPMVPSDLPAARELWSTADGVEIAEGDSIDELTLYLARNPGCSHVAIVAAEIVGAVLAGHDGRRGFLYHLAVAPKARGCGLGRKLAEAATDALRANGIARCLILVDRGNAAGFEFWRRCRWEDMPFAAPLGLDL